MTRDDFRKIAEETVDILNEGGYLSPSNNIVDLNRHIGRCVDHTKLYLPDELQGMLYKVKKNNKNRTCTIEVCNETTLAGAKRLSDLGLRTAALNFASARYPGGGFLWGALAQEESIARSSAIYASLLEKKEDFYDFHNSIEQKGNRMYSDRMIYSPCCPVFRDDEGKLLEEIYGVDFITSPAPNVSGGMDQTERDSLEGILRQRIQYILALAATYNCKALVLGAWGCGVFGNDKDQVARIFAECLDKLKGNFYKVCFSISDEENTVIPIFEKYLVKKN